MELAALSPMSLVPPILRGTITLLTSFCIGIVWFLKPYVFITLPVSTTFVKKKRAFRK